MAYTSKKNLPPPIDFPFQNCVIYEFDTVLDAASAAEAEAVNAGGKIHSGTIGQQGGRVNFNTTLSFKEVAERVRTKTPTTVSEILTSENRALMLKHVKDITRYIEDRVLEGKNYVLPGLILGVRNRVKIFVVSGDLRTAFMVMPISVEVSGRDGLHRCAAIRVVVTEVPETVTETISAMILFDTALESVHQDLIDIAQAKPMARAIYTTWRGNPIDIFSTDLIERMPFFEATVEPMADQLSPSSDRMITRSTLQTGLIEIAARQGREKKKVSELSFEKVAGDVGSDTWAGLLNYSMETLDAYIRMNPQWSDIQRLPDGNKIRAYREHYLHGRNIGFRAVCQALCAIRDQDEKKQPALIKRLAEVNMAISNPTWQELKLVSVETNGRTAEPTYKVEGNAPKVELLARYLINQVLGLPIERPKLGRRYVARPAGTRSVRRKRLTETVKKLPAKEVVRKKTDDGQ